MTKPLVLCILDGVGIAGDNSNIMANMPFFKELLAKYPNSQLNASGAAVGLPDGVMGNSEVGHMTIGAGRVINQFLRRFENMDLDKNKPLAEFLNSVSGTVHIIGLVSDGRVHSDIDEIIAVARRVIAAGKKVLVHFIADGRDTPPRSAQKYIDMMRAHIPGIEFATISGRYYAMDRNNNLGRTELAFRAIANGESEFSADTIDDALRDAYARGESDEFIKPTIIHHPSSIIPDDGIIFANYRADRARQLVRMLITTGARILTFSQYGEGLDDLPALLPDMPVKNTLGDVLAAKGLTQLRISETEKYNHITYFFDAERIIDFPGEEKVLIASPDVATFDLKPEMAAPEITDALLPRLSKFDVVILNYANGDMVGHTGNVAAVVRALQCLDDQLSRLVPAVLELGGAIIITADHGNAEMMINGADVHTAHTINPVPFVLVGTGDSGLGTADGGLADIAPTMLKILGISQPVEMTGISLV